MSVRVRFAPSPTGGLHIGGMRTVLYNYFFAKKHGGKFILRIEDTDRSRFVEGAEQYIVDCMKWCGIEPDESPLLGGEFGPYRQSERKHLYFDYAKKLIDAGHAYYAFDTPEELEMMRAKYKSTENTNPQYDYTTRIHMKNSLTLPKHEVDEMISSGVPYIIRIKIDEVKTLKFHDLIRGEVTFDCSLLDDKVLLKADGMPTYHLAVVVDDYLMKITHVFRGEEWLPSAPVHIMLWEYLGWKNHIPEWAHLPLILKPDGNGKLSKRDGARLGIPVFAMNWVDPRNNEVNIGFKESGFIPEALVNLLALFGWNAGTEQEVFSMEELIEHFSIERIHKGGAKFDYEKAKWFNHQYILKTDNANLVELVRPFIESHGAQPSNEFLGKVIELIKDRCMLLADFWVQGKYFFQTPEEFDDAAIKDKWNEIKKEFFVELVANFSSVEDWNHTNLETIFNNTVTNKGLKKGDLLLPLRIMLVGGKFGPGVFLIADLIGKSETLRRLRKYNHL